MPLIEQVVAETSDALQELTIAADRDTLTRRRWRGSALDGTDFAFALTDPVRHGSVIFEGQGKRYRVRQMPEPVLVVLEAAELVVWFLPSVRCKAFAKGHIC